MGQLTGCIRRLCHLHDCRIRFDGVRRSIKAIDEEGCEWWNVEGTRAHDPESHSPTLASFRDQSHISANHGIINAKQDLQLLTDISCHRTARSHSDNA